MTYNLRYSVPWASKTNQGYVYIDKLDSLDASENLILAKDGITISISMSDWNEPVLSQTAQIDIINNKTDFFELLPLLSAEEREYRIRINQTSPTTKYLFEGFLNSDIVEQSYLSNHPIRLVASNYIKKLENVTPSGFLSDVHGHIGAGKKSLIDFLTNSLKMCGTDASIRINSKLVPSGQTIDTTSTGFNKVSLDTELFWEDNINTSSAYDIISQILTPFNCFIYWYNGNWYIERYSDLWSFPKTYVEYSINASYGNYDAGTAISVTDVSTDIFGFKHIEQSQLLTITPGLNKIEINLNHNKYNNYVLNEFEPLSYTTMIELASPDVRKWLLYTDSSTLWRYYNPYNSITYAIRRDASDAANLLIGACTKFKVTLDSDVENKTTLNMKWKVCPIITKLVKPQYYNYKIKWYLRNSPGGNYIKYNDASSNWYYAGTVNLNTGMETKYITDTDLNSDGTYNMDVTIPLSDVVDIPTGDLTLIFGACVTEIKASYSSGYNSIYHEAVGDFNFTVNTTEQANNIQSIVSTKYLNKKTIELDVYDINNLNYKNGLFFGDTRTSNWLDSDATNMKLTDRLIKNKFQLYNQSRQSISSTIYTDLSTNFKPMSTWKDSNQLGKKFILTGYAYRPTQNRYDCIWSEYNNSETIILNNV